MKKVIALNESEQRVLTTGVTAEKNDWWITHNLEVAILPRNLISAQTSTEPEVGKVFESNNRFYRITKSEKVLICAICNNKANFKIGYRFYCKLHYKHLMLTKPIRRAIIQPERNAPCYCGSGKKFKNCCISKTDHKPRHYFNSLFMENPKIVKSLNTIVP
jgi:uncharacterized protein YecA (UPF0149 family)